MLFLVIAVITAVYETAVFGVLEDRPISSAASINQATERDSGDLSSAIKKIEDQHRRGIARLGAYTLLYVMLVAGLLLYARRREAEVARRTVANVGKFLAHDLKNELATVAMALEGLSYKDQELAASKTFRRAGESLECALEIVKKLERYPAPQNDEAREALDLAEMLDAVAEYTEMAFAGVQVTKAAAASRVLVRAQRARLDAALKTIVNNAGEAIGQPRERGRIALEIRSTPRDCEIVVRDNGRGMSPDVLKQIFKPLFTYGKPEGVGIGLASARDYVEELGGHIEVASRVGEGTTVTVHLPISQKENA